MLIKRTTKIKPADVKPAHILTAVKKLIIIILDLKLEILWQYENIKTLLQKAMFRIDLKEF